MKFYLFIAFIFHGSSVFACSCGFPDDDLVRSDKNSTYIFLAKPDRKNSFLSVTKNRYKFSNIMLLKGAHHEKLTVWSGKFFTPCNQPFSENKEYVIYAYEDRGKLVTDRCSSWVASSYKTSTNKVIEFYRNQEQP